MAGFRAARGILTSEGGKASHAALVARGMGKPCVAGASALDINIDARQMQVNGVVLNEGDWIALDGSAASSRWTTCRSRSRRCPTSSAPC